MADPQPFDPFAWMRQPPPTVPYQYPVTRPAMPTGAPNTNNPPNPFWAWLRGMSQQQPVPPSGVTIPETKPFRPTANPYPWLTTHQQVGAPMRGGGGFNPYALLNSGAQGIYDQLNAAGNALFPPGNATAPQVTASSTLGFQPTVAPDANITSKTTPPPNPNTTTRTNAFRPTIAPDANITFLSDVPANPKGNGTTTTGAGAGTGSGGNKSGDYYINRSMDVLDREFGEGFTDQFISRMGVDPIRFYQRAFVNDPEARGYELQDERGKAARDYLEGRAITAARRDAYYLPSALEYWKQVHGDVPPPQEQWEKWWYMSQRDEPLYQDQAGHPYGVA